MLSYPKDSITLSAGAGGPIYKPTEKLWLTADRSRLVKDGDPEAAFLFCIPGRAIPMQEAKQYGLGIKELKPQETKELRPERTKKR